MSTESQHWRKAFSSDQTGTTFAAKTPSTTAPSGSGIVAVPRQGGYVPNLVMVKPYGSDANDETMSFQVWGWQYNFDGAVYEATLIYEADCILGNIARGNNFFDCDTIADVAGDTDTTRVISPGSDKGSGYVAVDFLGHQILEFEMKVGTAAAANLLYRFVA